MAKLGTKAAVSPQFRSLYESLHQGLLDEKTIVPGSWFHQIETSLDTRLKEKVSSYQGRMGQVELLPREWIQIQQTGHAANNFLGLDSKSLTYHVAYHDNPDQLVRMMIPHIDMHLERFNFRGERIQTAADLDRVRAKVQQDGVVYQEQFNRELEANRKYFQQFYKRRVEHILTKNNRTIEEFVQSPYYAAMPMVDIESAMWAKILTGSRGRKVTPGDHADVQIISTYLPYVDVLATDAFMAGVIQNLGLDTKYQTKICNSRQSGLSVFGQYIDAYLANNLPVNHPRVSVFVYPDYHIKKDSFEFFRALGQQVKSAGEWIEVFAFDDGDMPQYIFDQAPNTSAPFYGLQDVETIEFNASKPLDTVSECRKRCRSSNFLLIDSHIDIPDNFANQLIQHSDQGATQFLNNTIYKK